LTDANLGAVEKLAVCLPPTNVLAGAPKLKPEDVVQSSHQKHDLAPMGVFLVKGWTRSVAAMCIMLCAFESEDFLQPALIYCSLNWVYISF